LKAMIFANRFFVAIVIVPTLLAAAYFYLVASDQYESSTDFVIRHAEAPANGGGVGQIFGLSLGASSTASEAFIVQEYLLSHDAVAKLRREDDLVGRFRPKGADWFSRLWSADPTPERLLKYYSKQVAIEQDETSGITHLTVHTFRPQDSYVLASKLLKMGEEQINAINEQTYRDQVTSAKRELDAAGGQLNAIQQRLTGFRKGHADVDPEGTGRAQLTMVTNLTATLVQARAQLAAMAQAVSRNSPQYIALQRQVQALEAQVAGQSSQIAGTGHSVANRLGDYEQLVIERDEAAKLHAATAAQYAQAVAEAKRKQLYLVRVVEPNRPVKSQFPERGKTVLTVFALLFFTYAIGWLLWAGVKEHSI
jgi:capsular polysaccharide transport system permease protein